MTKEDKDLLLKDLCARLPYGVKIRLGDYDYQVCAYNSEKEMPLQIWYCYDSNQTLKSYIDVYLTDYRPYLRPMSSMTDREKFVLTLCDAFIEPRSIELKVDVYNKQHLDYRGLIEKGLAIEVTEENNPYK